MNERGSRGVVGPIVSARRVGLQAIGDGQRRRSGGAARAGCVCCASAALFAGVRVWRGCGASADRSFVSAFGGSLVGGVDRALVRRVVATAGPGVFGAGVPGKVCVVLRRSVADVCGHAGGDLRWAGIVGGRVGDRARARAGWGLWLWRLVGDPRRRVRGPRAGSGFSRCAVGDRAGCRSCPATSRLRGRSATLRTAAPGAPGRQSGAVGVRLV